MVEEIAFNKLFHHFLGRIHSLSWVSQFIILMVHLKVFAVVNLLEKQSLSIYLDFWNAKYSYKAPTWYSMTSLF